MPLTPGLSPSLRHIPVTGRDDDDDDTQTIEVPEVEVSGANDNGAGKLLEIQHDDGTVTISLDGRSLDGSDDVTKEDAEWFDNLVDHIDPAEQSRIVEDLLRAIEMDIESRKDWVEERATGLKLLGTKVELPNTSGSSEGAPVEGMSRVRHPLLLEAVLRFQANARAEFLPTDGPVKVRNDDNNAELGEDELADALESDLNHYLTTTASEYYPDTDRMLLMLGFGGTAFKKVYFCPLRNRPVSESVNADDLIVNSSATDLRNAKRKTHRVYMKPSTVKRLQILGVYKDYDLSAAMQPALDAVQRERMEQSGTTEENTTNPADRDREMYECYCEMDMLGFEHKMKGRVTGLEVPYRVTIDVSDKKLMSIVRNYDEDTVEMPEERDVFVKYTFVPGFGFYDIGLLQILGNTTNALTAAWRLMLDAGMFANFPGFLIADSGARQNTNIFRVAPGSGAQVKTGGMKIGDAVMPLPYKEPGPAMATLVDNMAQTGQRIGGTSELQVGEGRPDAPVGTTLAMIEQATKVLNSVHKRMHAAQAEEFRLVVACFKEHPESFWQRNRKPAYKWDQETFLKALDNCELVPQSDPNTASHAQRVMKITGLKQLQAAQPSLYDPIAIDKAALQAMGWNNPEQFMAPVQAQAQKPPELVQAEAKVETEKMDAASRAKVADAKVAETQAKIQQGAFAPKPGLGGAGKDPGEIDLKRQDLQLKARQIENLEKRSKIDDENRDKDRIADLAMSSMELEGEEVKARADRQHEHELKSKDLLHAHVTKSMDLMRQREADKAKASAAKKAPAKKKPGVGAKK